MGQGLASAYSQVCILVQVRVNGPWLLHVWDKVREVVRLQERDGTGFGF